MAMIDGLRRRALALKAELYALWLAYHDPRVPWYARVVAACVVAYAFSPIDLIPDPIPVLGYLDDLVLVPLCIMLALRLIPAPVMAECRARAERELKGERPVSRAGAAAIVLVWLLLAILGARLVWDRVGG